MRNLYLLLPPLFLSLLALASCKSTGFPRETARCTELVPADSRIEISLTPGEFAVSEVEFHVDPSSLPEHILAAAREQLPGGRITDCEIEHHGEETYYEVTSVAGGKETEAMFTPEGVPHSFEVETELQDLPILVRATASGIMAGATIDKAETILDGMKVTREYHFKLSKDGFKYKAIVSRDAELRVVYRETIAEIEVPIR